MKTIFVIPSWYPSPKLPFAGSFIKEQLALLAEEESKIKIVVSLRHDTDLRLSVYNPFKIVFQTIRNTFFGKDLLKNEGFLIEIRNSAFTLVNGVQLISAKCRDKALHERNLKRAMEKYGKIDLIHAHVIVPAGEVASYLYKKYKIPYVITEHRKRSIEELMKSNSGEIQLYKDIMSESSAIIAVSRAQAALLNSISGVKALQIPNMTNEFLFKIDSSARKSKKFIFSTLCGLTENKGLESLIEAISIWNPDPEKINFKIGGEGYLGEQLKKMAIRFKVEDLIEWTGFVERINVPYFYQSSNVFVLPSRNESFGIVYIEALACGIPVIATKCGGPEEIVNEENGILIEIDNPYILSEALKYMYENYSKYNPLQIRKSFENRYSSKAVTSKILDIYNRIPE